MRAIILAAGVGRRLGGGTSPKCLLRFGGKTLLRRHLEILRHCGIGEVVVAVGYRADLVQAEITAIGAESLVSTVFNPDFQQGSIVTLWTVRDHLTEGRDLLLMDADVLYDHRLLLRLTNSEHRNCFLMDRDFEPGDEPVKLCVRDGALVEFRKQVEVDYDYCGESVGFFRLSQRVAQDLVAVTQQYVDAGKTGECYEEALRDLLLTAPPGTFGFEDISGLPWTEIDFQEDVRHARRKILPQLVEGKPPQK